MSKEAPFPDAGKLVTVIAVKEGDTLVTYGKVLVSRPNLVAVAAHVEPDALPGFHDSPLTLLYTVGELSFILRGRVRECIKPDRLIVVPTAEPRVGERREFIRADLTIACRVEPAQTDDEQLCREWVEGLSPDVTDYRFADTLVDLSGSGARFDYDVNTRKGDLVAVSFQPPDHMDAALMHLCARVIRCRPSRSESGLPELAIEFFAVPEDQRELLNFMVFQARAQQLGVTGLNLSDQ